MRPQRIVCTAARDLFAIDKFIVVFSNKNEEA